MANNAFFEFLKDANKELKGLYDDSNYYGAWANQYNPYGGRGVSNWFRGLGAINHMIDRNAANRARKAQQQAYKTSTDDTPPTNVGIGADANGVYGIRDTESMINAKPEVSISAGSYGNGDVTPQANKFSFNESDYIPSAGNGYHLGDYPQTEMYGDPTDYQRQMASNAIGYDLGSFEPRQQKWFTPSSGGNGFSSIFNGNSFKGDSLVNPTTPSVSLSDSLAQGIEGQNKASARDLSRYLSNDYNIANWMQADAGRGVDNPYISALRYSTKIAPLVYAAREDDMRNAFMTYNSENATPEQKADAIAKLAYYTKTPDLADKIQSRYDNDMYRRGYVRDNSDVGSNILSAFKDYEEGEQWMSPDGTGNSRTQCSNFVSDVLRKVGLNIGSPNGDELMKQFGKAYHTGLDGIQAGDVLNFKDHVGFYVGNGQYIARNSSGGVHQGSMEEAIKAFGQPLGYASVREYAAGVPRYRRDTSKESLLRQSHEYKMKEIEARNAYRNPKNGATIGADGYIKGSGNRNNALINGLNWYANTSEKKPEDLMKKVVDPLSDVFVDKLVQFNNENDALEQIAYDLVGGERYGSSGMSDEQLAEVLSEAAMKAGNSERIRYQTSGKNAIRNKLLQDILPRLHGYGSQTAPPSVNGQVQNSQNGNIATPKPKDGTQGSGNVGRGSSAWDNAFNTITNIPNAIQGIAKNDKAIGSEKIGLSTGDISGYAQNIKDRNAQELQKSREEYEEKKRKEEAIRAYLEATR